MARFDTGSLGSVNTAPWVSGTQTMAQGMTAFGQAFGDMQRRKQEKAEKEAREAEAAKWVLASMESQGLEVPPELAAKAGEKGNAGALLDALPAMMKMAEEKRLREEAEQSARYMESIIKANDAREEARAREAAALQGITASPWRDDVPRSDRYIGAGGMDPQMLAIFMGQEQPPWQPTIQDVGGVPMIMTSPRSAQVLNNGGSQGTPKEFEQLLMKLRDPNLTPEERQHIEGRLIYLQTKSGGGGGGGGGVVDPLERARRTIEGL